MNIVVLYTSTDCPNCKVMKKKLKEKGVSFTERNVDLDEDAFLNLLMLGRCTVPTLVVNGEVQDDDALDKTAVVWI